MARSLTAALATEFDSSSLRPVFFAKFEFTGGDVRFWSGSGDKTFNSETYTGLGDLGIVSFPPETVSGGAGGAIFSISGIPSSNTSLALSENYQNYPVTVWVGALDDSDNIVADPYEIFYGLMDVMEMTDDGETASISLKAETFVYGVGASNRRYTKEDQVREYSGDIGLSYVSSLQNKEILWGVNNPIDIGKGSTPDDYYDIDDDFYDG